MKIIKMAIYVIQKGAILLFCQVVLFISKYSTKKKICVNNFYLLFFVSPEQKNKNLYPFL